MRSLISKPIRHFALGIFDGPHATPKESDSGAVFLGIKNITSDGRLDFSEVRYVSEQELPRWTKRVTPECGDVVLTYEATLHHYAIIPEGFRGCLGRRVALIRPDPTKADSRFLLYYLLSRKWRDELQSIVKTGATVDRVPLELLPNVQVTFPCLAVQKSVSQVLSAYDDLIENNRRRMALLEESARLLYREWFVRLRFPGHERTKIVDGVPAAWSRTALGDVLTLKRGHDLPEQNRLEGEIPVVSSSGITGWHNAKKADPPGVVTGRYGTLGEVYYIDTEYWPLNTALYVSDFKAAEPLFAFYCLQATLKTIQSDKAAVPGVNRNVLHAMPVLLPPASLRIEFVTVVNPIREMISKLMIQNERLRGARDMLLPRLMSGEVKV